MANNNNKKIWVASKDGKIVFKSKTLYGLIYKVFVSKTTKDEKITVSCIDQ